jgi:hypothetical protein
MSEIELVMRRHVKLLALTRESRLAPTVGGGVSEGLDAAWPDVLQDDAVGEVGAPVGMSDLLATRALRPALPQSTPVLHAGAPDRAP